MNAKPFIYLVNMDAAEIICAIAEHFLNKKAH